MACVGLCARAVLGGCYPRSPPWPAVQQQTQRWLRAGCFESMAEDLRLLLRLSEGRADAPSATILDSRTLQSTPEAKRCRVRRTQKLKGSRSCRRGYAGAFLALKVTAANEQDRAQVANLARAVQAATGQNVQVAFVDQGYTGEAGEGCRATRAAAGSGQTSRSQARLCAAAAPLGGGTLICVGRTVSPIGAGLRATSPQHSQAITGSPSPSSCSNRSLLKVHDRL